jgi:tetratricopeptide (TPR) repeat protein
MRQSPFLTTLALVLAAAALAAGAPKRKPTPKPTPGSSKPSAPVADASAEANRARSLVAEKRYAEGEAAARNALGMDPAHEVAAAALGNALVSQKKYDDAIQSMSSVIAARKDAAYAYFWRGQAYNSKKQPDRMISDFETFLRLQPNAPEAPTVRQVLASFR